MTDLKKMSEQFQADELPTKADIDKLDKLRFRDFLRGVYKQEYPDTPAELTRLLQNMNLATEGGNLNLAGVLLFVDQPEFIVPQFVVKAIRYPGNEIHATDYVDTEDFSGNLRRIFDNALGFVMRNLHKVRAGRGVNAPGLPDQRTLPGSYPGHGRRIGSGETGGQIGRQGGVGPGTGLPALQRLRAPQARRRGTGLQQPRPGLAGTDSVGPGVSTTEANGTLFIKVIHANREH